MAFRVLTHASEILTGAGVRKKDGRRVTEPDLQAIADGALVYSTRRVQKREIPHRVVWVGPTSALPAKYRKLGSSRVKNLRNQKAVVPGLIDCHTHLVFDGDRSEEFAARCAGATYQEIAARGGGIQSTVRATRDSSPARLERLAVDRVREMERFGVRVIEAKSGYGLDLASEVKCLEVVKRLRARFPHLTFQSTFLGAHAFPPDHERSRALYLEDLCERMLPEVARRRLADACDVFVDEGYFTIEEARRILARAKKLGLAVKVHADELGDTGSAAFAASIGALSADHLLKVSDAGIQALASSQTVAVLLPGTAFYLKAPHAPARRLIDAGAAVALSTDFNPGTSMCLSLPAMLTIAALYLGMSKAEIFAAVTYNAAKALGLQARKGTLEIGMDADFTVLEFERFEEVYYRFAWAPRAP